MRVSKIVAVLLLSSCSTSTASRSRDVARSPADSIVWQTAAPLPTGRDHHGTFITNRGERAYLWIVGGNDYRRTMSDAWRAPIGADGELGAWVAAEALPGPRAGMGVAMNDRLVVLTGGKDSAQRTTTDIFTARVAADGTLGSWARAGSLPAPRFHHSTVIHGNRLYVVGGLEASVSVPAVHRATLSDDGEVQRWDTLPPLPRPRSHNSIFVHDGALYLVGGLDGNPAGANTPLSDVLRAPILDGGDLGAWEEVSRMEHAYATHATAVHDGAVWLFGGVEDNARFVDVVLRAPFTAGGRLGQWKRVMPGLPAARSHVHQAPVFRGRVYSAAGSNRRVVTGDVQIGRFVPSAPPVAERVFFTRRRSFEDGARNGSGNARHHRNSSHHRDRRRSAGEPRFLYGRSGDAARQAIGQSRRNEYLSPLLRRRRSAPGNRPHVLPLA